VDTQTGKLLWVKQVGYFGGAVTTQSPVVYNGIVYIGIASPYEENIATTHSDYSCCIFRGNVVAVSESEPHRILWRNNFVPRIPLNPGGYSGASVWGSTPVVDPARGSLYVGTGNNYSVPPDVAECISMAQTLGEPDSVCNGVDNYGQDYFDSIVALDLNTGALKWGARFTDYDTWNGGCSLMLFTCPSVYGLDSDFSAGPNLFQANINGTTIDVLGEGQKTGVYYGVDPGSGALLWSTSVGGGARGQQWGTATDGQRIYVPYANYSQLPYTLQSTGVTVTGGAWNALDPATGRILWQTATPGSCPGANGPNSCRAVGGATVANGVVYVGSLDSRTIDPTMFALNAATGQILWSFASGLEVHSSPAIVGNTLYWGSGYVNTTPGTMYALTLPAPAISLVQQTESHGVAVSEQAFGSITVGQGDLLVAHATVGGSGVLVSSVSDNQANPWARIAVPCGGRTVLDNELWYTASAAGGPTVVTLNLSGTAIRISMSLSEWSGALPTWSHDADSSCNIARSSTPTTSSLNTTGTNDLVLAACSQDRSPVILGGPANAFAALTTDARGPLEMAAYAFANGSNGPFQTSWTTSLLSLTACSVTSFTNSQ
jgi:hypothetical protein